jgi:hypothetical protein
MTSMKGSIQSISWFWETRESNSYQIQSTVMMQLLFGCARQKQVLQCVPDDDWVKGFSSSTLKIAQIEDCHGWSFNGTVAQEASQLCLDACKCS